ncbi:PA0069 family radical SAM protein [Botrimarina sp.]|uniref:PA0069 family radical SAM protein n=1 Tax=Botrimarina sp. TaxID=2795802 RepID=UPI0032EF2C5B
MLRQTQLPPTDRPAAARQSAPAGQRLAGRGAACRPANPHLPLEREDDYEHLASDADFLARRGVGGAARQTTRYGEDASRSIVNRNDSPDLPFRWSVNPYRGCEHGCSYCYARPTHEFLGLDAGLGFETQILAKPAAPELFRKWLDRPAWIPEPIVFSGVTDCYQPLERKLEITRRCLAVAAECRQPVGVVTKNRLVTRDLDLLSELAEHRAAVVAISLTTLDTGLARRMEPRTSTPDARLEAIRELAGAGVPVHAMLSPVIPGLNDHEIPALIAAAAGAGAGSASYTLLRLPGSVREVFLEWLRRCDPDRAPRVEALIRGARGGGLNDSRFGERMRGAGAYAGQVSRTFRVFAARHGLPLAPQPLSARDFRRPAGQRQQRLFS